MHRPIIFLEYSSIFTTNLVQKLPGKTWSEYSAQNAGRKKYTCWEPENADAQDVTMTSQRIAFPCIWIKDQMERNHLLVPAGTEQPDDFSSILKKNH